MSFSDRKTTGVERSAKGTIDNLTRESIIDKVIFELGIEGYRNEQGMGPYIPAEHYATQRQGTVIMHGVSGEVPKTHDRSCCFLSLCLPHLDASVFFILCQIPSTP